MARNLSGMNSASNWTALKPLGMRRRAALPILLGTRFPAPFGGSLRSSVATKPTATFSGPHCGLRLLCLPHESEAGRISAEHVTLKTAFCQPLPRGEQLAKPLLGAGNHLVVELES